MKTFRFTPAWQKHRVAGCVLALIGLAWLGLTTTENAAAQAVTSKGPQDGKPLYIYTLGAVTKYEFIMPATLHFFWDRNLWPSPPCGGVGWIATI